MKKKYNVISLFSGAMGLDLGIEQSERFRILACVEKEQVFCDTIRRNQSSGLLPRKLIVFNDPIEKLDPLEVLRRVNLKPGELDLLVGGPPCQAFSTAGKRLTVADPRGTLIWQFLRFVEAMRPKAFLMENVRGLLSAALRHRPIKDRPNKGGTTLSPEEEPGSVIQLLAEDMRRIQGSKYVVDCFEVNAVNYGAPQLRERIVMIGNRYESSVDFPDPTHGAPNSDHDLRPWATLRDAIGHIEEVRPTLMDFSPRKKRYLSMVPPGGNWRSLPMELQKESMGQAWRAKGGRAGWWRRLSYDLPCPTLVTMPNHASTALCHPLEVRTLSVLEYARIQEFPARWKFCGTPAQQYAQVGNAVPVRLGLIAGRVVANLLDCLATRRWRKFSERSTNFRVVYVQSHVRTRKWFHEGQSVVFHQGKLLEKVRYSKPKTLRKLTQIGARNSRQFRLAFW